MSDVRQVSSVGSLRAGREPAGTRAAAEHEIPRPFRKRGVPLVAGDDPQVRDTPQGVHGGVTVAVVDITVGLDLDAVGLRSSHDSFGVGFGELQRLEVATGLIVVDQGLDHRRGHSVPTIRHGGSVLFHRAHAGRKIAPVGNRIDREFFEPQHDLAGGFLRSLVACAAEVLGQGIQDLRCSPDVIHVVLFRIDLVDIPLVVATGVGQDRAIRPHVRQHSLVKRRLDVLAGR